MRGTKGTRAWGAAAVLVLALPLLGACASSSSSASAGASPTSASPTSTDPVVAVIGMTEAEAAAWAKANNFETRVVEVDGKPLPATMDYRPDRINLTLEKGVVTKATMG